MDGLKPTASYSQLNVACSPWLNPLVVPTQQTSNDASDCFWYFGVQIKKKIPMVMRLSNEPAINCSVILNNGLNLEKEIRCENDRMTSMDQLIHVSSAQERRTLERPHSYTMQSISLVICIQIDLLSNP